MTIAYIDVAKAPVQVPVIDLLQEPQGAAFDFISGKAWIVDKVNPANTMLRNIGDVLTNLGASPTKLLRSKSGLLESAPWWANEYDLAGNPMGMRVEAQRTRTNTAFENLAWNNATFTSAPNAALSPLGQMTATKLQEVEGVVGVKRHVVLGQGSPDTTQFESIFAKAAERSFLVLTALRGAIYGGFVVDLLTGATRRWAFNSGANAKFPTVPRVEIYPDGWVRVDAELLGMSGFDYRIGFSNEFGVGIQPPADYAGEAGAGIYVWGRNNIADPVPGSLIAGEGSAVTRAADQPQISTGFLPYNPAAGTLILDGMAYDYDTNSTPSSISLESNSVYHVSIDKFDTSTRNSHIRGYLRTQSPAVQYLPGTINNFDFPVAPNPKKAGLTWNNVTAIVAAGASGTTGEMATPDWPAINFPRLLFGSANGIMWYRSAIYIPRKLTAAELLARVRA